MNAVDIAILVILGAFLVKGLVRGLLKEVCSLLGLVLGAVLAFAFHQPLAAHMAGSFHLPENLCTVVAFVGLFLASLIFFGLLGYLLSRFVKLIFLGGFNRVAGGLFGLVQGGVLTALVLFAFSVATLPDFMDRAMRSSQLAPPFVELGRDIFEGSARLYTERG